MASDGAATDSTLPHGGTPTCGRSEGVKSMAVAPAATTTVKKEPKQDDAGPREKAVRVKQEVPASPPDLVAPPVGSDSSSSSPASSEQQGAIMPAAAQDGQGEASNARQEVSSCMAAGVGPGMASASQGVPADIEACPCQAPTPHDAVASGAPAIDAPGMAGGPKPGCLTAQAIVTPQTEPADGEFSRRCAVDLAPEGGSAAQGFGQAMEVTGLREDGVIDKCVLDVGDDGAQASAHDIHVKEDPGVCGSMARLRRHIQQGSVNALEQQLLGVNAAGHTDARHVIVLGLTGSGKSTLVNSLAGCKLRNVTEQEAEARDLPFDAVCVSGLREGGPRDEVATIGNCFGESQTKVLQAVAVERNRDAENSLVLWDAPGFEDSGGAEQNIANAVNLQRLLKASARSSARGFVVLVVLDAPSLDSGRGSLIKRTLDMLSQLFGGQEAIKANLASFVFCITKASAARVSLKLLQNWVVKLSSSEGVSFESCRERMVLYDPLRGDDDKQNLVKLLRAVVPVGADHTFQTSLNAQDEALLHAIANECASEISTRLRDSDSHGALDYWNLLEAFDVIQHQAIRENRLRVRERAVSLMQEWREQVRALKTDHSESGRKNIKLLLKLLETSLVFFTNAEVSSAGGDSLEQDVGTRLRQDLDELLQEVKEEESKHQEQQDTKLRLDFADMLQALTRALTRRADLELEELCNGRGSMSLASLPAQVGGNARNLVLRGVQVRTTRSSGAGGTNDATASRAVGRGGVGASSGRGDADAGDNVGGAGIFAKVGRVVRGLVSGVRRSSEASGTVGAGAGVRLNWGQPLWRYFDALGPAAVSKLECLNFLNECQEGKDVVAWFASSNALIRVRRKCVSGDQRNLRGLFETLRGQLLDMCRSVVSESKLNYDVILGVHVLAQRSDAAIEAEYSKLSSARLYAKDVAKLTQLGFASVAKHVKQLEKLIEQAARLRARAHGVHGRVGVLQATARAEQEVDGVLALVFERACCKKQEWTQRCTSLAAEIDQMLLAEQFERDVESLLKVLDVLKDHVGSEAAHIYRGKLGDIKAKVNKMQSEGDLMTLVQARNFNEIVKRYRTLKLLREKLVAHLALDETALRDFTVKHLDGLVRQAEDEVHADVGDGDYLRCKALRSLTAIWPTLRTAFPGTVKECEERIKGLAGHEVAQTVVRVKQDVVAMGKDMMTKEAQERIARMLVKGYSIAIELQLLPAFQKEIQKVLDKGLNDEGRYIIGMSLEGMAAGVQAGADGGMAGAKTGDEAAEIARAIIDSFPAFKNFNIKLFNAKAAGVTFDRALSVLRCFPARRKTSAAADPLRLAFKRYDATYSAEVNAIVRSLTHYPMQEKKQRIADLSAELRPFAANLSQQPELLGELLGLVCASWTYLSCSEGGRYSGAEKSSVLQPHHTQILGIFRLLAIDQNRLSNHLIQINTGEGKSIALGFTAVILASLGFAVDVVCYSRYLCERDCQAFSSLFQLLDQRPHISYNDFNALSSKIMQSGERLPEVRANFQRFLRGDASKAKKRKQQTDPDGKETGKKKYNNVKQEVEEEENSLSQRGGAKRCKLKGGAQRGGAAGGGGLVAEGSAYDMEETGCSLGRVESSSKRAKRGGSAGQAAGGSGQARGESKTGQDAARVSVKRELDARVKQENQPAMQRRASVLLLDEVDVFFGEGFYGMPYRPCVNLEDESGFNLLQYLWLSRHVFSRTQASVAKLMARREVISLQVAYPNLSVAMLEREILKMLDAALRFPQGSAPKLRGGEQDFSIQARKRICYIDPSSGVPCLSISYGYVTAFTYFHCEEQGSVSMEAVKANVRLQPICGTLSYSQIPTFYQYCLGMTGTLECLTNEQNDLLAACGFHHRTFLPSTFNKQALNALQKVHDTSTVVVHGSYEEFFTTILDDITRELTKGRAILIVFADALKLKKFSAAIHKTSPNLPQYTPPLELTDQLSNDERASVVMQAIRRYKITLMTRSYGRGTDFVCRDQGLVKNGGVHIVVTFLPEDDSEWKQLMGRTCRQDDPGSGRKILFAEDLKYLDATENKFMASGLRDWDAFLLHRRNEHLKKAYEHMQKSHKESMDKHRLTLRACAATDSRDWSQAAKLFFDSSEELATRKTSQVQGYHVVFVLDESGSMSGAPWRDLVAAVNSFLHVRLDAGAQDVISIVPFSHCVRIACQMQPLADVCAQLSSLLKFQSGGTMFSPALAQAHKVIAQGLQLQAEYSPLLLFMSDGGAPDGEHEMGALHATFFASGLQTQVVGFGAGADEAKLMRMAGLGGGKFSLALDGLELKQCFEQAAASLSHCF